MEKLEKRKKLEEIVKVRPLIGEDVENIIELFNVLNISEILDDENTNINIKKIIALIFKNYKNAKEVLWKILNDITDEQESSQKWSLKKIRSAVTLMLMDEGISELFTFTQAQPKK